MTSIGGNALAQCTCGKFHYLAYLSTHSTCTCGVNLWDALILRNII